MFISVADDSDALTLDSLYISYGNVTAISSLSLRAEIGKVTGVFGSNGAGKSTLLKGIMGLTPCQSGKINLSYDGRHICLDKMRVEPRARVGLRLVQDSVVKSVFTEQSVHENLLAGAYTRNDRSEIVQDYRAIIKLFPQLSDCRRRIAGTLSGGELRMLSIGIALMGRPKVLLLDEPSSGLAPKMILQVLDAAQSIARGGVAVVVAEQNAEQTLAFTDSEYLLTNGQVTLYGNSASHLSIDEISRGYIPGAV